MTIIEQIANTSARRGARPGPRHPHRSETTLPPQSEPDQFDVGRLTEEIERIFAKRKPPQGAPKVHQAWLGEEEDLALVERGPHSEAPYSAAGGELPELAAESSQYGASQPLTDVGYFDTGNSLQWVRKARQQRLYGRLRTIGGWVLSFAVVAIVILLVLGAAPEWSSSDTAQSSALPSPVAEANISSSRSF